MDHLSTGELLDRAAEAHRRESRIIGGLGPDEIRAPSRLPGWSRGHVIAARVVFTRAMLRQIAYATTGRAIDFFDDGRAGRDAEIERLAARPPAELVSALHDDLAALHEAWSALGTDQWALPVTYRGDSTLTDLLRAGWRECELHLVDLDVGVQPSAWSEEFCLGLFRFLAPRVPAEHRLVMTTPDGRSWEIGTGDPVTVRGDLTDLAAWLAGRPPQGPVSSSTGTLPTLQGLRGDGRRRTSA